MYSTQRVHINHRRIHLNCALDANYQWTGHFTYPHPPAQPQVSISFTIASKYHKGRTTLTYARESGHESRSIFPVSSNSFTTALFPLFAAWVSGVYSNLAWLLNPDRPVRILVTASRLPHVQTLRHGITLFPDIRIGAILSAKANILPWCLALPGETFGL